MTTPVDTPSLKLAARRKLVRGVFAAPAVLTVCDASATAASSSMRCVANQVNSSTTIKTVGVTTALDSWLRVQLWTRGSGGGTQYFISGADVHVYKRSDRSCFIGSSQWQEFNVSSNVTTGGLLAGMPWGCSRTGRYAGVRFDAAGNIIGVGHQTSGSMMPGTCWTSFRAGL